MATDWEGLLPQTASRRVIESAIKQSVALQLGTVQPMPAGVEQVPVVSVAPTAGWVEAGARKPIANVEWSALTLQAREIAAVCAIPDAYIDDTAGSWSPTESAENELAKAVARVLDAAILWGVNAPPGFPAGGIAGAAGAARARLLSLALRGCAAAFPKRAASAREGFRRRRVGVGGLARQTIVEYLERIRDLRRDLWELARFHAEGPAIDCERSRDRAPAAGGGRSIGLPR